MVIWKKKDAGPPNYKLINKTRFAFLPKFEFDDAKSSGDECGDMFWLEKYIITKQYVAPTRKWKTCKIERYGNAVFNKLSN